MTPPVSASGMETARSLVRAARGNDSVSFGEAVAPVYVSPRNRVARVPVADSTRERGTVIVKERRGEGGYVYDVDDVSPRSQATRTAYEAASLGFLATTTAASYVPKLIGIDYEAGLLVLEDLGEGQTLADLLVGDNRADADAGLRRYARSLGSIHASTAGRHDAFAEHLSNYGRRPAAPLAATAEAELSQFIDVVEGFGTPLSAAAEGEIRDATARMVDPGAFLVWTHGDTCPGHDRHGDTMCRFIDVEFGAFRHALVDLAYLYVPFPSCGFAGRLPAASVSSAVAEYRAVAGRALTEIADDREFERELAAAWAYWIVWSINVLVPGTTPDAVWGNATHRQRLVQRLADFGPSVDSIFPALASWAEATAVAMTRRWPDQVLMPRFSAYAD